MIYFGLTSLLMIATVAARPQEHAIAPSASGAAGPTPIPIVSQTEEVNPDGSFKFSYETGNGIKFEESGYLKDNASNAEEKIQVIQGSVTYTDNDGQVISLKYIADENGFQPEGDHIPKAPTLPEEVAGAAKNLPAQLGQAAQPLAKLVAQPPGKLAEQHPTAQPEAQPEAPQQP